DGFMVRPLPDPIPPQTGYLQPGQPVFDRLASSGDVRRYFIETTGGVTVTIAAYTRMGSSAIPRIELVNPGGDLMLSAAGTMTLPAIIPGLALLEAGRYSLFVTSGGGGGEIAVGWDFGETYVREYLGEAAVEIAIRGELTLPGSGAVHGMWLNAGDVIDIAIDAGDGLLIALNRPGGARLATSSGRIDELSIPVTGWYEAMIFAPDGTTTGVYEWRWERVRAGSTPTPALLPVPLLTVDTVLSAQRYLFYPFYAPAGQTIRAHVSGAPPVDPVIAVLDDAGAVIAQGDDSASSLNPDIRFTTPRDGTYTVRVHAYNGEGGAATISVELER
ncbi:MAG: PPC domain-containing protein, partial [Anaerolinea sp.]|nr:PPC domain-containing protein [Anaerolinea sp.]